MLGGWRTLVGVEMGVPADAAFAVLVRTSQGSHRKLRDVAAALVHGEFAEPKPSPLR